MLDDVIQRRLDAPPVAADVFSHRDERPRGAQRLVVADGLELKHGFVAELDGALRRVERIGNGRKPPYLAGGAKLEDAIAQLSCEVNGLFLSGGCLVQLPEVGERGTQLEQQLDSLGAARLRHRDRPAE